MQRAVCWYLSCDRYWEDAAPAARAFPWPLLLALATGLALALCMCYYIIWIVFEYTYLYLVRILRPLIYRTFNERNAFLSIVHHAKSIPEIRFVKRNS